MEKRGSGNSRRFGFQLFDLGKGRRQSGPDEDTHLDPKLLEDGRCSHQKGYGATTARSARAWADGALGCWQMLATWLLLCFILAKGLSRFMGKTGEQEGCAAFRYPQCEAALVRYLEHGAAHRCEAFERVKAEGDYFKFPNSADKTERCTDEGCCGCRGQCSQCPPVLAECMSWRLDGEWKVAFNDGSEAKYTFDAKGHLEAELPLSLVPKTWKRLESSRMPGAHDNLPDMPQWLSLAEAQELCANTAGCEGATWDSSKVQTSQGCWKPGVKYNPLDMPGLSGFAADTPQECNARCKRAPGCARWSLIGKDCHLHDAKAQPVMEHVAVSGSPGCLDETTCGSSSVVEGGECLDSAELGSFGKAEDCLSAALQNPACGSEIMWSPTYFRQWGCHCCQEGSGTKKNPNWEIQTCTSKQSPTAQAAAGRGADVAVERYEVWLKSSSDVVAMPGWQSMLLQEPHMKVAAIAGSLVPGEVASAALGTTGHTFFLDLHKAAPEMFPAGTREIFMLVNGELLVQREAGVQAVNGTGIKTNRPS